MKNYIFPFLFSCFILLFGSCSKIDDHNELKIAISYFQDVNQTATAHSILQKKLISLKSANIGFENGIYWFKVVINENTKNKPIVFDIPESNLHNVEIYQNKKKIEFEELANTHFSLLVPFKAKNPIYYLKVRFDNEVYFPLKVKYYDDSQLVEKYTFFKNGFYYGFVLVALLLNIFFYFSLKDKTFIYYCLFLASITVSVLSYDGFLKALLPVSFAKYSSVLTHYLIVLFGFLFGYKFLSIDYYLPKSNKLGFSLLFIATCSYLLFIPTENYLFVAIADTVSFFVLLHNWIVGIIIYKKHEFAKFFVIGYSFVLFAAALFIIPINWGINMYTTSLDSVKFGSLFEVLILTYAITYRVTILHKENELFKLEIKQYLSTIKGLNSAENNTIKITFDQLIAENNLSEREANVLELIFKGYTNKRIAEELFVSLNTVKYHIRNIYQKLNIKSKNEAIDLYSKIKEEV